MFAAEAAPTRASLVGVPLGTKKPTANANFSITHNLNITCLNVRNQTKASQLKQLLREPNQQEILIFPLRLI